MQSDTKNRKVATPQVRPGIDALLDMASAGMDAQMQHKHAATLASASASVERARSEAELLGLEPDRFEPNKTLAAAGDVIRKRGWTKGVYSVPGGAVCAMAAIREVLYGRDWHVTPLNHPEEQCAVNELLNRIAVDVGNCWSIPKWNDTRQDQAEVLRLLY